MDESGVRKAGLADTGRAVAFSDAVFAIIITLLVLDLRPPEAEPGRLLYGLLRQWPNYLAYVTSYLYIGVVWTNHKSAFRRIRWIDRGLHWANLGVLFTTALLPFPTAVLSKTMQHGNPVDERTAAGFYALIGALLCASWLFFYDYLRRHQELAEKDVPKGYFPAERTRALTGVAIYSAAGLLGYLITPSVALAIFLILPIFYGLTSEGLYELPAFGHRYGR